MTRLKRAALLLIIVLVAGCASESEAVPVDQLFPPSVGPFLRSAGPFADPDTGGDTAVYVAPQGEVTLFAHFVGEENVPTALSELPLTASEVGYDEALGPREGTFFTYNNAYHAAWGNGDWVFVLTATTDEARRAFLAGYGF